MAGNGGKVLEDRVEHQGTLGARRRPLDSAGTLVGHITAARKLPADGAQFEAAIDHCGKLRSIAAILLREGYLANNPQTALWVLAKLQFY